MAAPGIKAIIFDCFGVLYTDSKWSLRKMVDEQRLQEIDDLYSQNDHGFLTRQQFLERIAEITGKSVDDIESYIASEHHLNVELVNLIHTNLHHTYRIGLLSNIGRGWINDFFDKHQLHDLFDEIVLSGEEGVTKPSPSIFLTMAERLGLKPEQCIMIDDIAENCAGAQAAGMQTILFQDNQQLESELYNILGVKSD